MPERSASLKGIFIIARKRLSGMLGNSILEQMNAELCKKALEKIGSPNVLINMVSRRVRQLTAGDGGGPFDSEKTPETLGARRVEKNILRSRKNFSSGFFIWQNPRNLRVRTYGRHCDQS